MNAKSGNRRTATALVLWVAILILTGTAFGQTAERYVTLDFNRATAHVFDAATNTEVAAITVGNGPNSIVISPNGRLAFVSHFFSSYVSVIDLTIAAEIKRIPALVFQLGISADGATVVGTDQNDDGITVIDASTLSVRTISFNGRLGDDPTVDGDAFASNPVVVGNKVYLETGFDFGVIDLATGIVTDLGSTPASNFLSPLSDVSVATADGRFVMINRDGALVFINTATNLVRSVSLDFAFAFAVSASRTVDINNGVNYAYILRIPDANVHFSIVDVPFGIVGDLALPPSFPIDLLAHIVPNSDGTRVLITTHAAKPNVYIVDTSNPFAPALVGSPISLGTNIRGVDERITQNQPPATAPVVAAVSAPLVVNSATTVLQISGSGFAPDAQVRIDHLDPQAAQFISPSLLQISVPADAPAQNASIIVTNPDLSQGAAGADQSGILRNALAIASGPAFQPINQVAVVNAGDATLSVLNTSATATPNPIFSAPDRIVALAITPDGRRAYVERTFAPATVDVFNFITNSFEASIPLNASPAGQPGQTRGIVIAPRFSTGRPAAYVASSVRTGPGRFSLNLYVIDADSASATFNTLVATLPTGEPQASPSSGAIAVTPDGHFAFVNGFEANGTGDLVILDLTSGVSTVIPMGTLGAAAFQPMLELSPDARFLVLVANDGSARVFDVSNPAAPVLFTTIQSTPPAGFGPLLLEPRIIGNRMYTFDHVQNVVAIFNFNPAANDFSQLATFAFPAAPTSFAIVHDVTPDGKLMYLPLREQDAVAVVDTAKVLAGDPSALVTEIGAGISPHLAAVRPVPPVAIATAARYTGDTTRNYHDIANLSATLVVQGTSSPISGQTITFTLGTQSCAGTTDATGAAACSITLNQVPGSYTVKAVFAGSGSQQAAADSAAFTITREETATRYTGPGVIINGTNTTFSAVLQEDGTAAIAGRAITITLGSGNTAQTCNGITDATGTVSCSIVVNQPAGPGTVAASFTGDAFYLPSSGSAVPTVVQITVTTYTGATTQNYHDMANLSATLTVQGTLVPIPNQTITFTLGTQSCAGTTSATGVAACSIVLNQVPGFYTVNASFAGSANNQASSDSKGFTITGEETATIYTGPTVIANGANTTFSAVLKEDGIVAIAGRTITITLSSGNTAQTCNGTTDATGTANCSIVVNQPLGPGTVAANFAGDALYLPSSSSASTILFAFPAQGAFVLGDQTASGAVEFWGDDWATVNILSGGPAPDAFKGFAANTSEPPTCGSAWTTDPGTSSQPPAGTLPSYMGVIVSTRVGQSGSTISGDVSRLIVVTPNEGYDPNAGHSGTGTVVATYCSTGGPMSQ